MNTQRSNESPNSLRLTKFGIVLALFTASSMPLFAQDHMLTITSQTSGVVRVGADIACGTEDRYGSNLPQATTALDSCSHSYTSGSMVNLRAVPNHAYTFIGWLGDCTGESSLLALTMNAAKTCRAAFARPSGYIQADVSEYANANRNPPVQDYACALIANGTMHCWGGNNRGNLGDGTTTDRLVPTLVAGINNIISIATGAQHTCAVLRDGQARCWGWNSDGQLGDGTETDRHIPTAVTDISNAVAISAGGVHTCAVLNDGQARCWGSNGNGRLGDGTETDRLTPTAVSGISNVATISAENGYTCATLSDGQARCWGSNSLGRLGDGTGESSLAPVAVLNINNAVAISTRSFRTCAVLSNGQVKCWGNNRNNEFGEGAERIFYLEPVTVSNISNVVAISAGLFHICTVLSDGQMRCWGDNDDGQLGVGTTATNFIPTTVTGISTAAQIVTGEVSSCAVLRNGLVYRWGSARDGVIGNGVENTSTDYLTPQLVANQALTPNSLQVAGAANHLFTFQPRVATSSSVWTINPTAPIGFRFSSQNGVLYGVSATTRAAVVYTLSAQGASDTLNITLTLSIVDTLRLHLKLFLEGPLR